MAVRTSLMEFQIPKIVHEEIDENRGIFQIEPLDRGFGYTFGNSLRRVLLSSLEGAAVTSVKIEGVAHEFTTLTGVREDVTDILLNFKNLIARLHGDSPEIDVRLSKLGAGSVTADDIEASARPQRRPTAAPARSLRLPTGWRTSRSRSSSSACARTTASSASGSKRSGTSSSKPRTSWPRSRTSARSRSRKSRRRSPHTV